MPLVFDTNVVSELMRPVPDEAVLDWVGRQDGRDVYLTAVGVAELKYGIALLPTGQKRRALGDALDAILHRYFDGKVLPFDGQAAAHYAILATGRRRQGRPISGFDCQIAAIVAACNGRLATRNVRDFVGLSLDTVNPWNAAS